MTSLFSFYEYKNQTKNYRKIANVDLLQQVPSFEEVYLIWVQGHKSSSANKMVDYVAKNIQPNSSHRLELYAVNHLREFELQQPINKWDIKYKK